MSWTLLTNHAQVLRWIADDPTMRLRDVAARVGITERGAQRIVSELEQAGFLTHERIGRRNRYHIQSDATLDDELGEEVTVGDLLRTMGADPDVEL
jgi:DNA-binding IclR family transcriptional regulator